MEIEKLQRRIEALETELSELRSAIDNAFKSIGHNFAQVSRDSRSRRPENDPAAPALINGVSQRNGYTDWPVEESV